MTTSMTVTDPDTFARITWATVTELGNRVAGALTAEHGAEAALDVLREDSPGEDDLITLRERALPRLDDHQVERTIRAGERLESTISTPSREHWPARFADLGDFAPRVLWVRGNPDLPAAGKQVAVVGARAATGYGEHVTMEFCAGLAGRGYTVTGGAVCGIDGMAHCAVLASRGSTVAYLAGGVDRVYQSGHDACVDSRRTRPRWRSSRRTTEIKVFFSRLSLQVNASG